MHLSKKAAEDLSFEEQTPAESVKDSLLDRAIDKFGEVIEGLGYTDFEFEMVETPFETNRGVLLAKGTFKGPSPFGKESRAPKDISEFAINIAYDEKLDSAYIEVKHEAALIATYQIKEDGIELIDGDIPHV